MPFKIIKNKNIDGTRGFTLIEALVAIVILITAVTATFTAVQSGIQSSIQAKNQITAFYLAQEAVEFVRNKRDQNSIAGANWLTGIASAASDPCYPGKACSVDVVNNALAACSSGPGSCSNLTQDTNPSSSTYGLYSMDSSWTTTGFSREVEVEVYSADQAQLTVTIGWSIGPFNRTFVVEEIIANWQS